MQDNITSRTYVYLHTNGKLITKSAVAVGDPEEYFESDFVVAWWRADSARDILIMVHDVKNKHADIVAMPNSIRGLNFNRILEAWNITKADYFQHVVKMAAREEL